MSIIHIITGRNNKGEFLADGEIYGVVSAKSSPPRGSGKTLTALDLIFKQANILNYGIVFNFDINCNFLYYYCYYKKYWNVIKQICFVFACLRDRLQKCAPDSKKVNFA